MTCASGMGSSGSLPLAGGIDNVGERRGRWVVVGKGGVVKFVFRNYRHFAGKFTVTMDAQFRPIRVSAATREVALPEESRVWARLAPAPEIGSDSRTGFNLFPISGSYGP